ncbi:flagellar type III secretion system pore protein FliP [Chitinivibrio alkaliphilus]|uniref:Flagellar biosynthetic protein FliP n=1 Tax=Chitinivibrio alkaliphilus ACht1 TaxID=1313304 RepID=U7DEH6_9BACT|nr:flagellar type III secretion system pore protein FliP [Chitinivibrio alkaliphilus]ERP39326.1 flagellar biosynthetic protein FliP [Chitinivibrio alkaliphilus ACht1]
MKAKTLFLFTLIISIPLGVVCANPTLPSLSLSMGTTENPQDVADVLQVVFLITILSIAPSILIMTTSFVRIIIVFSFIRRALGLNTMPPDQILVGLALFLTFFIMAPVFTEMNDSALQPYLAEEISWEDGLDRAAEPLKAFMLRQVNEQDVALLLHISETEIPEQAEDLSLTILIPAFMISELKTAFIIGFIIFIPFLVIDMIVASVLMSMGMMMLPPVMISLPFKVILFVLIDGWNLIVRELVISFF